MATHGWTYLMTLATVAFLAQWTGVVFKKKRIVHVALMNFAIWSDLFLVLGLEIKRHAIETVIANKLHGLQVFHVLFSATATVLYIPILLVGWSLFKNAKWIMPERAKWVVRHRQLGYVTLGFRTLGWLMMWSLLD